MDVEQNSYAGAGLQTAGCRTHGGVYKCCPWSNTTHGPSVTSMFGGVSYLDIVVVGFSVR